MKNICTFLIFVLIFPIAICAQSPQYFNYQAVVRDNAGAVIANQYISLQISILQENVLGTVVYSEIHKKQTNQHGLVNLQIGDGAAVLGSMETVNWGADRYFIKIEIDKDGGTNFSELGTQQLVSVPYSMYANKAGNVFSGSWNDLTDIPNDFSDGVDNTGDAATEITGNEAVFNSWDKNSADDFSGNYADLSNKPNLFSGTWNDLTDKPDFFSGSWFDLSDKPVLFSGSYTDLINIPILFSGSYTDLSNKPELFSGSWNDLIDIPAAFADGIDNTGDAATEVTGNETVFNSWDKNAADDFSGNYADLQNKPVLFSGSWNDLDGKPEFFSGNYTDLSNKPQLFSGSWNDLADKPMLFSGSWNDLTDKPFIFGGSFNDLTGRPTTIAGYGITDAFSGSYADLSNKPVIFSGSWLDLSDKPTSFDDADADSENELITSVELNGKNLEITEAGTTKTVSLDVFGAGINSTIPIVSEIDFTSHRYKTKNLTIENGNITAISSETDWTYPNVANLHVTPWMANLGSLVSDKTITIKNVGDGIMTWYLDKFQDWLTLSKASGTLLPGEETTVIVTIDRTGLSAGSYTTQINVASTGGSERIVIAMEVPTNPLPTSTNETENNNDVLYANLIGQNTIVSASIGNSGDDADWYKVFIAENGRFYYTVTNQNPSGTANGGIGDVLLYTEDMTQLITITAFNVGAGKTATSYNIALSGNSYYYIKVKQYSSTNIAPYTLQTTLVSLATEDQLEPNQSNLQTELIAPNATFTAIVGYQGDEADWYRLAMPYNGIYNYTIKNLHNSNHSMQKGNLGDATFYTDNFDQLTLIGAFNIQAGKEATSVNLAVSAGETYLLRIIPSGDNHAAPYELFNQLTMLNTPDYGEPNNTQYEATTINVNTTITALSGYQDDEADWYKMVMPQSGTFTFTVANLHNTNLDVNQGNLGDAEFYNSSMTKLKTISAFNLQDGKTSTSSSVSVSAGETYYIKIQPINANSCAPYSITTELH